MFVFPMAGLSNRFANAGYQKPKYMLPAGDKTLFEHSIAGFHRYFKKQPFLFIYLKQAVSEEFILEKCHRQGIPYGNIHLAGLRSPTDGQAATVQAGLESIGVADEEPLTIFNIDTIYRDFELLPVPKDSDIVGFLDVIRAEGTHWSFVKPRIPNADVGEALAITEKQRISDLCSTGLYHFRDAATFSRQFETTRTVPVSELQAGERYIAPMYNRLLEAGHRVSYRVIPRDDVQFSGTPDEYAQFVTNNGWRLETPEN